MILGSRRLVEPNPDAGCERSSSVVRRARVGATIERVDSPLEVYSDATVSILKAAGYRIAFDSAGGVAPAGEGPDRWHLERIEVIGEWSLGELAASVLSAES